MLLTALYEYGRRKQLLEREFIESRVVHYVIPISFDGEVEGEEFIPLKSKNARGNDELGMRIDLPRCPVDKTGGKSDFLAAPAPFVIGYSFQHAEWTAKRERGKGEKLVTTNAFKAFLDFWEQVEAASRATTLPELSALTKFRKRYIDETGERLYAPIPFVEKACDAAREDTSRRAKVELNLMFRIEGRDLFDATTSVGKALHDYWREEFRRRFYLADEGDEDGGGKRGEAMRGLCLVSGAVNDTISRSHLPKLKGVRGAQGSGARLVSFAEQYPAFSSYGFKMGGNAPVSERAAATYGHALNALLADEHHRLHVGAVTVCWWTKTDESESVFENTMGLLGDARPDDVEAFLKAPFKGAEWELLGGDAFYSVTLVGKAGRIAVRRWIEEPLRVADENLRRWFADLDLETILRAEGKLRSKAKDDARSPLAIYALAKTTVRPEAKAGIAIDVATVLVDVALEGTSPPVTLLKPVLDRLAADFAKNGARALLNESRFRLIRMALNRTKRKGEPTMEPRVFETDDAAYNLGRLLAVLDGLQAAAHDYKLEGASVVERYFGAASAAPATAFGVLWRLHVHHLKKLRSKGKSAAATGIERRIAEIASRITPAADGAPPDFPRILDLRAQGRFALGFYQQRAADERAKREAKEAK